MFFNIVATDNVISLLSAMIKRNLGRPILNLIISQVRALGNGMTSSYVRVLVTFVSHCSRMARYQGLKGLVLYLKACHICLAKTLAGDQATFPSTPRMRRGRGGLPTFIPVLHRIRIMRGDPWVARYWFTLFSVYRVLEFPGKLNLSTVTDPGVSLAGTLHLYSDFASEFWEMLLGMGAIPESLWSKEEAWKPLTFLQTSLRARTFLISRTTPSASLWLSTSPQGIIAAILAWAESPLLPVLKDWIRLTHNTNFLNFIEEMIPWARQMARHTGGSFGTGELGRIGLKDEPAGKIRVFAMVDPITQWLMEPLHKAVFRILRKIPQDGTFDQLAPVNRLFDRGKTAFWSFDLSAATDRLPVLLQAVLLSRPLTAHGANLWIALLTARTYVLPPRAEKLGATEQSVMYRVGQPMGALSSWAMLALVHHFLVQYAASLSKVVERGQWFEDYAVLGDDLVIADSRVASEYLRILESIGVGVNLSKSVQNPSGTGTLEFAKRIFSRGVSVSALPLLEVIAALRSLSAWQELARYHKLTLPQALMVLGYGWKAVSSITKPISDLPRRLRGYVLSWTGPGGPDPMPLLSWLQSNGGNRTRLLTESWPLTLIDMLLQKINDMIPTAKALAKMVEVDRTRTHYGTIPYTMADFPFLRLVGPDQLGAVLEKMIRKDPNSIYMILTSKESTLSDSDLRGLMRLIEFCYRDSLVAFLPDLRALERDLEALKSDLSNLESLEELLERFTTLEKSLGDLGALRTLNWRSPEASPLRYVRSGSWIRRWIQLKAKGPTAS